MLYFTKKLAIRVTAATQEARDYWHQRIMSAICEVTGGATTRWSGETGGDNPVNVGDWGYWGPTNEYEPSVYIEAACEDPQGLAEAIWPTVQEWMVATNQQAVYMEIVPCQVFIMDQGEAAPIIPAAV